MSVVTAYVDSCAVGAICCRLEPLENPSTLQRTYIMTLGVLESYRQCHIGERVCLADAMT